MHYLLIDSDDEIPHHLAPEYMTDGAPTGDRQGRLYMPYKDIMEFKEMRPPDIMPQVATQSCRVDIRCQQIRSQIFIPYKMLYQIIMIYCFKFRFVYKLYNIVELQ